MESLLDFEENEDDDDQDQFAQGYKSSYQLVGGRNPMLQNATGEARLHSDSRCGSSLTHNCEKKSTMSYSVNS